MQSVHQVLHLAAVRDSIDGRQEDCPSSTEDEESHTRFFGEAPPLVLLLEVDKGIDAEDQLSHGECEDDSKQDTVDHIDG